MASLQHTIESAMLRGAMALPERAQRVLLRKPVIIDGQTLATELQMMLTLQRLAKQPDFGVLPVREARELLEEQSAIVQGQQAIGAVRELVVDGADGPLEARLYIPSSRLGADSLPTMLFIHGGGHGLGSLDTHEGACRHLAERAGIQVLSIAYRLAPEAPFPAAVNDCFAAYQWLVKNTGDVNADPERLAVGGDSAGGNLAATTAIQAAEAGLPMAFQLLVYPVTDFVERTRSRELFDGGGFYLCREGNELLLGYYLPAGTDPGDGLASVGRRTSLPVGLAPAFVVTAGFDPLRDEGEAYGRLLAEHGVAVETKRYPSMTHGFFNIVGVGREARVHVAEIADRVRVALS